MSLTDPRAVSERLSARRGVTSQQLPSKPSSPLPRRRIAPTSRASAASDNGAVVPFAPSAAPLGAEAARPIKPGASGAVLRPAQLYPVAKRALDITLSAAALLILFPLFAIIALAIWVEDRGPVFFSQQRIGCHGVPFRFFKFRSMVRNADALKERLIQDGGNEAGAVIFKMKHDPRVTRVGRLLRKYSLDELPQFLNVLNGDMSLVGPRPHLPREVDAYKEPGYHARNSVPPGLLCLREVQGRSNLTFEQWIALDLLYIEHQGMRTDLWILMRALPAVLKAEGAC